MKLKKLLFASAMSLAACGILQAQNTQVIAHRGFWKTDGSAQNSIAALVKADSIHCYGSEFDVWLTADNKLIVDHDGVFKGVRMETSTEKECTSIILDNGENLPTLQQYLNKAKGLKTRLILELVNAWTVNDAKDMERLISQGVDFITTNEPVLLQEILKKK